MYQKKQILVVDDSKVTRQIIRRELEEGGYEVFESSDGNETMAFMLMGRFPDLITLDIEMPGMSGFEVFEKIKKQIINTDKIEKKIPIVFITSHDTVEDRKKGFSLGAADFISKPCKKGDILKSVDKILKPSNNLNGMRAVIVEDNPIALEIVCEILKREGVNVITADNGIKAFEIICNEMQNIDIVITDLKMPVMNGDELTCKIRNELKLLDIPIIFLTAISEHAEMLNIFKAGANDYLIKPFVKEELISKLTVHLKARQLNKQLKKIVSDLKTLNKMKDNLIAVCSHDLKNPIHAILGYTHLMIEENNIIPEYRDYLLQIQKSGEFLQNLINDILDLSKIKLGATESKFEPVFIAEAAKTSIEALKRLADEKEQSLNFYCDYYDVKVNGNRLELIRVFNNILSNAIKFTNKKGKIDFNIKKLPDDKIEIKIRDNGIGIPKDDIPDLFNIFTKISKPGTNGEKGTGLGMGIVKEIIEKHNGELNVSSEVGLGTIFTILLPELSEKNYNNSDDIKSEKSTDSINQYNILLADDNPINSKLAKKFIQKAGHNVTIVNYGKDIINYIKKYNFDIIFIDTMIFDIDTIALAKELKSTYKKDIPIIALTDCTDKEYIDECYSAGIKDYIEKPYHYHNITSKIEQWTQSRAHSKKGDFSPERE